MAANWEAHFSKGLTSARPAANTLPKGAIYWSTDDKKFYVGSGAANTWGDFTDALLTAAGGVTFAADIQVPDDAYDATGWNGNNEVPTKNAIRDRIETLLGGVASGFDTLAELAAGKASLAGDTFTGDVVVPDEAYDATAWNGSLEVPTKNAIRDKIESIVVGGGSSGYVMREEHVASASASLDFTAWYDAAYETYVIELIDIVTASNTELTIKVSTDGGSTWLAGTTYNTVSGFVFSAGSGPIDGLNKASISLREGTNTTLLANTGYSATIKIQNPGSSAHKMFNGQSVVPDNSIDVIVSHFGGRIKTTSAINGIQVIAKSGNLTSGTARVYGIAKA
jgi:hypothetical protein